MRGYAALGLITSQIDTAPKLHAVSQDRHARLITSQIDTAPKRVRPYDLTLLRHEAIENGLMEQGISYREAHKKTVAMGYDYQEELLKWREENGDA